MAHSRTRRASRSPFTPGSKLSAHDDVEALVHAQLDEDIEPGQVQMVALNGAVRLGGGDAITGTNRPDVDSKVRNSKVIM